MKKKKKQKLKKFFVRKSVAICTCILACVTLFIYLFLQTTCDDLSIQVAQSTDKSQKEEITQKYMERKAFSEISLVIFSVIASSAVSAVIIEKRNSNELIKEVFVDDFFATEEFIDLMDEKQQKTLLCALERELNFDGNTQKSEMYVTILEKLNKSVINEEKLYYDNYYLDIKCDVKENHIEKTIIKKYELKPMVSSLDLDSYLLLSATLKQVAGFNSISITRLKINNEEIDVNTLQSEKKVPDNSLHEKSGYNKRIEYKYNKPLHLTDYKPIEIELQYITRCPLNDLAYTCRMPYPCKNFSFKYSVENEDYQLSPTAFGFIDDAKNSPNHSNDRKNVTINFNNWIFPLDGVCVYLEKTIAK